MGVGEAYGEGAAQEAIKNAIQSPLLDNMNINGALGVLVHFKMHPNCSLDDLQSAMSMVEEASDDDADVIFGTTTDENIEDNKVEVTIIATGFKGVEKENEEKKMIQTAENDLLNKNIVLKRRVSGGYNSDEYISQLDIPSYLRHQMD